jgi:hypothetical protein
VAVVGCDVMMRCGSIENTSIFAAPNIQLSSLCIEIKFPAPQNASIQFKFFMAR